MGQLMRQYWMPVLLSAELEPGGRVKRVRLLGEDLVALRARDGKVGLLGEHCSHRRASLYFGRNEEAGLRCVYHGWKYGLDGQCLEMPNEDPEGFDRDAMHEVMNPEIVGFFDRKLPSGRTRQTTVRRRRRHVAHAIPNPLGAGAPERNQVQVQSTQNARSSCRAY